MKFSYDESSVPSAPVAASRRAFGGRLFEQIRRGQARDTRQCAPFENTWLALDRIVLGGRPALLFHPREARHVNRSLDEDLVERDLTAVGFEVLHREPGREGPRAVITEDCPGVRLRALAEALKLSGTKLPGEVAWHVVSRTAALCEVWRATGIQPLDTFIGFDGSIHLFPVMAACFQWEISSFNGDVVFDPLLVDGSVAKLAELLCATLPESQFPAPRTIRERMTRPPPEPVVPREVQALLEGPRTAGDAAPALASLVREHFPRTLARHQRVHGDLGSDLETCGRAREARILAGIGAYRDPPAARRTAPKRPDSSGETSRGLSSWLRRRWPWG